MKTAIRNTFDAETGALPEAEIIHLAPAFAAPSNYKDPEKIAAYVAEAKRKWIADAALSPITGRLLAIGVKPHGEAPFFLEAPTPEDEPNLIAGFWELLSDASKFAKLAGWGIETFDLPFIIKRSWKHRIPVPMTTVLQNGRFLGPRFLDLMKIFQAPNWKEGFTSLDTAAQFLGVGKKNGEGAKFAETYAKDRAAAIAYLANDLTLTESVGDVLVPAFDGESFAAIA